MQLFAAIACRRGNVESVHSDVIFLRIGLWFFGFFWARLLLFLAFVFVFRRRRSSFVLPCSLSFPSVLVALFCCGFLFSLLRLLLSLLLLCFCSRCCCCCCCCCVRCCCCCGCGSVVDVCRRCCRGSACLRPLNLISCCALPSHEWPGLILLTLCASRPTLSGACAKQKKPWRP